MCILRHINEHFIWMMQGKLIQNNSCRFYYRRIRRKHIMKVKHYIVIVEKHGKADSPHRPTRGAYLNHKTDLKC